MGLSLRSLFYPLIITYHQRFMVIIIRKFENLIACHLRFVVIHFCYFFFLNLDMVFELGICFGEGIL